MAQSTVLKAFHPPPHVSAKQEELQFLCPVRAVEVYLQTTYQWRKTDQLLVFSGPLKRTARLPNKLQAGGLWK